MYKAYAGIGSREAPYDVLDAMEWIAQELFEFGYTLRSGRAPGSDQAFEKGLANCEKAFGASRECIQKHAEIYLPWKSFEQENATWIEPKLLEPKAGAYKIAEAFHPGWKYLRIGAKKLHARNSHQMYGESIDEPKLVEFVVCWTKGGKRGGGTGQALRMAQAYDIKIYDIALDKDLTELTDWIIEKSERSNLV